MATESGSVCLNHPDRPADTKCTTCFKPVCADCALQREELDFCSEQCAENYMQSAERISTFRDKERRDKRRRFVRKTLKWTVTVLVIVLVVWYFNRNPAAVRKLQGLWNQVVGAFSGE